ncbi:MAG: hypothetical protein L6R36_004537 [Xanthoria steineri]|nr:MAG: hypothetical protein L6R36_004537 [Xanthoria steineri]
MASDSAIAASFTDPHLRNIADVIPFERVKMLVNDPEEVAILPPGPQVIEGGVNDPAPVPPPSPTHGSYHWVFERAMSAALIPLTIAPFAASSLNPVMDALLCAGIIIHSHIGFQSSIIDYVPDKRLPKTRAFFWWALRAATVVVAIGFFEFETNDVGVTEAIKKIWTAKRKEDSYVEPVLRGVA